MIAAIRRMVRSIVMFLLRPVRRSTGSLDAWLLRLEALREGDARISRSLDVIDPAACSSSTEGEAARPIFVLGASWRSGTTLVQRLIIESAEVLVWGEPFARAAYVQRLAKSVTMFQSDWPPESFYFDEDDREDLTHSWIGCLYPDATHLRQAHRAFFRRLFGSPAREAGYDRWGVKEVRLHGGHVRYLDWLFPEAKFVLIIRNPYSAYASYRRWVAKSMGDVGRGWYSYWPRDPVFTPRAFGRHWSRRAEEFLELRSDENKHLVRYEAFTGSGDPLQRLREFLDIQLPGEALQEKVGSTGATEDELKGLENWLLTRAVEPLADEMDY